MKQEHKSSMTEWVRHIVFCVNTCPGVPISMTRVARTVGTTVTLSNLFYNYKVRQHELQKNIKREFNKCSTMLQSYALIGEGIRLTVASFPASNTTKKA
jgi:DNA mismatch repair ATPase MutL